MLQYVAQRLLLLVPTFLGVTFLAYAVMLMAPGDPVDLFFAGGIGGGGEGISTDRLAEVQEAKEGLRRDLGLDRPIPIQYALWLSRLLRGDLGESFKDRAPVWNKIRERLPVTIALNVLSLLLTFMIALPLGIYSAVRTGSRLDQLSTLTVFMLYSLPSFWVGTLILIFLCGGDYLDWFPPGGLRSLAHDPAWPLSQRVGDYLYHLAMPLLCTTYAAFAALSRFMRTSMLENARQDFIRTARAKGVSEPVVILKHMLRNSLVPVITILAGLLPALIGGSIIIETIFSVPGIGQLSYQSVLARDYPVVIAIFAASSFLTIVGILLSDLALAWVDPRIHFGRSSA